MPFPPPKKIRDLSTPYNEMAIALHKIQTVTPINGSPYVEDMFVWQAILLKRTPEGKEFWQDVSDGKTPPIPEEVKQCYPHIFN